MLARDRRLRLARDIRRVYARGSFAAGRGLTVKAMPNRLNHSRAVVVVGRKVSTSAVTRNRIRRRFTNALAQTWQTVPAGYDIVVTINEDAANWPSAEISQHLSVGLRRAIKPNVTRT
jgi:ribonuclease P protein component